MSLQPQTITVSHDDIKLLIVEAIREVISPWLKMRDMMERYGVKSTKTIAAMERRGEIPKRHPRLGLWSRKIVNDYQNAQRESLWVEPTQTIETGLIDGHGFHLYRHFDKARTLLYVGVSLSATKRLAEHKKNAHWFLEIAYVEVVNYVSREQSLIAERIAIRDEKPLHNIAHNTAHSMRLVA